MSDFDLYKENIQPRRRGHSAQELSNLSKLSDPRQGTLERTVFYRYFYDFSTSYLFDTVFARSEQNRKRSGR